MGTDNHLTPPRKGTDLASYNKGYAAGRAAERRLWAAQAVRLRRGLPEVPRPPRPRTETLLESVIDVLARALAEEEG